MVAIPPFNPLLRPVRMRRDRLRSQAGKTALTRPARTWRCRRAL